MTSRRDHGPLVRAAARGDVAAKAALLLERVASGSLARDRLVLAAYCLDEAAVLAVPTWHGDGERVVGWSSPDPEGRLFVPRALRAWVEGLKRWSCEATVRAAIAAARAALPARLAMLPEGGEPAGMVVRSMTASGLRSAIADAEAWLSCPCEGHVAMATRSASRVRNDYLGRLGDAIYGFYIPVARNAAAAADVVVASGELDHDAVVAAIRADVVAWALA